jgi:hypothetical protein
MGRRQAIEMGSLCRDRLTGLEGYVIAKYEFVSGCVQYCLEYLDKDGKRQQETYDEQRLEKVKATPPIRAHRTGADATPPASRR